MCPFTHYKRLSQNTPLKNQGLRRSLLSNTEAVTSRSQRQVAVVAVAVLRVCIRTAHVGSSSFVHGNSKQ